MALNLGTNNTDRVVLAASTSLDTFNPGTLALWVRPTTLTSTRLLCAKAGGLYRLNHNGTTGNLEWFMDRAGTDMQFITNDTPLASTNVWYFVAVTVDTGGGAGNNANIYTGTLASAVAERAYGTATDGTGGINTNSLSWGIGNRGAGTQNLAFEGDIAWFGFWTAVLTLGQLREQQYRMRNTVNCQNFMHLGYNGVNAQIDYSGNKINGTVTGAVVSAHVPLSAPWGWDQPQPPKNRLDNPRLLKLQPGFGRVVRAFHPGLVKARL